MITRRQRSKESAEKVVLQRRNDQRTDNRTEPRGKNLLLAMRDSLARSSIGSRLMSYHASLRKDLQDSLGHTPATSRMSMQDTSLTHMARPPNTLPACDAAKDIVHKTNFEPSEQRRVSFCQVKRIVSSRLSRSTSPITLCGTPMSPDCVSHTRAATTSGDSTASDSTAEYRTPPSTPHLDYDLSPGSLDHELYHRNPESAELIREGKRPAQPTSFTEDSEDEDTNSVSENDSTQAEPDHSIMHEDAWVGMGHVLAISRKERRASGPPCVPVGEYSKSRESWLAMHAGFISPNREDWAYRRWRAWHEWLDRQESRCRMNNMFADSILEEHHPLSDSRTEDWSIQQTRSVVGKSSRVSRRTI